MYLDQYTNKAYPPHHGALLTNMVDTTGVLARDRPWGACTKASSKKWAHHTKSCTQLKKSSYNFMRILVILDSSHTSTSDTSHM